MCGRDGQSLVNLTVERTESSKVRLLCQFQTRTKDLFRNEAALPEIWLISGTFFIKTKLSIIRVRPSQTVRYFSVC